MQPSLSILGLMKGLKRAIAHNLLTASLLVAFPFWFALGVGPFIWIGYIVLFGFSLAIRQRQGISKSFVIWILFFLWMLASLIRISEFSQLVSFAYRSLIYLSAGLMYIYVFNRQIRARDPGEIQYLIFTFWLIIIIGGWVGITMPQLTFRSVAQSLLPGQLSNVPFIRELVTPRAAQLHTFLGYSSARPAAPFTYTNEWASNASILAPVAIAFLWNRARNRLIPLGILTIAIVPFVFTLCRGAWLSVIVAGLVLVFRTILVRRGRRSVAVAFFVLLFAFGLLALTPLGETVLLRIATPHSNETRLLLYKLSIDMVSKSPVLGYGAPVSAELTSRVLPSIGTHGQLWMLLVSHGIPATFFFIAWFVLVLWRSRHYRGQWVLPARLSIFIGLIQMAFYSLVPAQIHLLMMISAVLDGGHFRHKVQFVRKDQGKRINPHLAVSTSGVQ